MSAACLLLKHRYKEAAFEIQLGGLIKYQKEQRKKNILLNDKYIIRKSMQCRFNKKRRLFANVKYN